MKNFAPMFIKSFFATGAIAVLCAAAASPAVAQNAPPDKVEGVVAEILPATTFEVKVSWDRPNFPTPGAGAEVSYTAQLALNDTVWAQGENNNVPSTVDGSPTDAATPDGVSYYKNCGRAAQRPVFRSGFAATGTNVFLCAGQRLSVTYRGLTAGTTYKFRVRAFSPRPAREKFGAFSDEVVFAFPAAGGAPGALTITAATGNVDGHAFTANWMAAANAEHYFLRWRTADTGIGADDEGLWQDAGGDAIECNDNDGDTDPECGEKLPLAPTSYTVTGLRSATEYDYEIRAANINGIHDWTSAKVTTTASTVSRLQSLEVKHGSDNNVLELQPAFDAETLTYAVTLINDTSIKVSAAVEVMEAEMKIGLPTAEAGVDDSVTDSVVSGLSAGSGNRDTVNIIVTPESGSAQTYVIIVTHAPPMTRAEFLMPTVTARTGQPTPNLRVLWNAPTTTADTDYAIAVQVKLMSEPNWTDAGSVAAVADVAGVQQLPRLAEIAEVAPPPAGMDGVDITGLIANTMYDARLVVFGRVSPLEAFASTGVETTAAQTARTLNKISSLRELAPRTLLVPMAPTFSPTHFDYEVVYDRSHTDSFFIAVTPTDPNFNVAGTTGFADQSAAAVISTTGVTTHLVVVTAEDGFTTSTYTIRAINPLDAFNITSITPTGGGDALTFSPVPDRLVFAYTAGTAAALTTVPSSVHSLDFNLECTACGSNRSIGVRGFGEAVSFAGPVGTPTVPLKFGVNHIDIGYANNKEPVVYTLSVIRENPSAPPPAVVFADPAVSDTGVNGFSINWTRESNASGYFIRWRTAATEGIDGVANTADDVAAGPWQNAAGDAAECNDTDAANDDMCGQRIDDASLTSYAISALRSSTPHDYSMRAFNSAGISDWTESAGVAATDGSTDSTLASLSALGADGENLITAFDPATETYALGALEVGLNPLRITAVVNESRATITGVTLDGVDVNAAAATGVEFSVDINAVADDGITTGTIVITVAAGVAIRTTLYTLTFTRLHPRASDVNRDGGTDITDGFLIARYLLGLRGDDLIDGITGGGGLTDAAQIEAIIAKEEVAGSLDVNRDGFVTAADGILIARFWLGVKSGGGLTDGQVSDTNAAEVPANINSVLRISPAAQ